MQFLDTRQQLEQQICQTRQFKAGILGLRPNVDKLEAQKNALEEEQSSQITQLKTQNQKLQEKPDKLMAQNHALRELVTQDEAQLTTMQQQIASWKTDYREESTSSKKKSVKIGESSQNTNGKN